MKKYLPSIIVTFIVTLMFGFGIVLAAPTSTITRYLILDPSTTGDPTLCLHRLTSGLITTSTADCGSGGGGGSGSGNLFVTPTSSVGAFNFPFYLTAGSSTVSATSSLVTNASGSIGVNTSTIFGAFNVWGQGTSSVQGTATSSNVFFDTSVLTTTSVPTFNTQLNVGDLLILGDNSQSRIITAIGNATSLLTDYQFSPQLSVATSFSYQPAIARLQDSLGNNAFLVSGDGRVIADQTIFGSPIFPEDAGIVSWSDMSVSSTLLNVPVGYAANLDGNSVLSILGLSDGTGGVKNFSVVIGPTSTMPFALLSVASTSAQTPSSSLVFFGDGISINGGNVSGTILGANVSAGSNADFLNFQVNSSTRFKVSALGFPTGYGTTTATVGGSLLAAVGNCTSVTTVIPFVLSTSTDIINKSPQNHAGVGLYEYESVITAVDSVSSTITTSVCAIVVGTPATTPVNIMPMRINSL